MNKGLLLVLAGGVLVYLYRDELLDLLPGSEAPSGGDGGNIFDVNGNNGNGTTSTPSVASYPKPPWHYDSVNANATAGATTDVAKEIKVLGEAQASNLSFWEWNYFYTQVTGETGPDPFYIFPGNPTEADISAYKIPFTQYWGIMKQVADNAGGLGRLIFPGAFGSSITGGMKPTGMERLTAGWR